MSKPINTRNHKWIK